MSQNDVEIPKAVQPITWAQVPVKSPSLFVDGVTIIQFLSSKFLICRQHDLVPEPQAPCVYTGSYDS